MPRRTKNKLKHKDLNYILNGIFKEIKSFRYLKLSTMDILAIPS